MTTFHSNYQLDYHSRYHQRTPLLSSRQAGLDRAERRVHIIPPITCEMGRSWDQPDRTLIEVDDTHAIMTRDVMLQLADYSHTLPTGVYDGKMWRKGKTELRWFGPSSYADKCAVNIRRILLVDGE